MTQAINVLLERLVIPDVDPTLADELTQKVITVRLTDVFHTAIAAEADRVGMSMNRLCLLKLAAACEVTIPQHWLDAKRLARERRLAENREREAQRARELGGSFDGH